MAWTGGARAPVQGCGKLPAGSNVSRCITCEIPKITTHVHARLVQCVQPLLVIHDAPDARLGIVVNGLRPLNAARCAGSGSACGTTARAAVASDGLDMCRLERRYFNSRKSVP
jgi:hypothetical protein